MTAGKSAEVHRAGAKQPLQSERPDVFLSYTRADEEFVRAITAALTARGKDVWVDWEDIEPSADWWQRIERGIESASAFVAVISPEHLASEVCARELAAACAANKRIVPILRRDVDATDAPAELARPNWIVVREGDDVEAGVQRLMEALDLDLEWADQRAHLFVRAREWERERRNSSFLLRGSDLRAAEAWLAKQGAHDQVATPIQSEYVLASRRSSLRRQRVTLGAVAAALAVSIALSIVALVQRARAVTRAKVAQSQALAARADARLSADPAVALALAVRAMRTRSTSQARDALRRAYLEAPLLSVRCVADVGRLDDEGCGASLSPDGGYVLATGGTRPRLWSIGTGRAVATLAAGLGQRDAAFSADSRFVATEDGDRVHVWSVPDGKRVATIRTHVSDYVDNGFFFGPNGRLFVVSDARGTVVFATKTWRRVRGLPHEEAVAFRRDEGVLVLRTRKAFVFRETDGWNRVATLADTTPRHIPDTGAFSPDGRRFVGTWIAAEFRPTGPSWGVAPADDFTVVSVFDATRWRRRHSYRHVSSDVNTPTFSPDGRLLALVGGSGMTVWSTRTWRKVYASGIYVLSDDWRFGITDNRGNDGARDLVDVSSGKRLGVLTTDRPHASVVFGVRGLVATAGNDGMVRVWQPVTPDIWSRHYVPDRGRAPNIFDVGFTRDRRLVAVTIETEPVLVARADGLVVRVPRSDLEASSASFSPDGRYLVASDASGHTCNESLCEDGPAEVRTAPDWRLAARFRAAPGTAWSTKGRYLAIWGARSRSMQSLSTSSRIRLLAAGTWTPTRTRRGGGADFSADDTEIVSVDHGDAVLWSSARGRVTETIREPGEGIASAELGPRDQVVTIDRAGGVRVWRSARSSHVLHVPTPTALAVLSTDRRLLALTSRDGRETTIWDVSSWKNLAKVAGVFSAFSGDDRLLLTQTLDDHIAHAWEARTGESLMEVASVGGYAASAFTPDGQSIVAVGTDARVQTYPSPVCEPVEQVEAEAGRRG